MKKKLLSMLLGMAVLLSGCGTSQGAGAQDTLSAAVEPQSSVEASAESTPELSPKPTVDYIKRGLKGPEYVELLHEVLDSMATGTMELRIGGFVLPESAHYLGGSTRTDIEPIEYAPVNGRDAEKAAEYIKLLQEVDYNFNENFGPDERTVDIAYIETDDWTIAAIRGPRMMKLTKDGVDYFYYADVYAEEQTDIYAVISQWYADVSGIPFLDIYR